MNVGDIERFIGKDAPDRVELPASLGGGMVDVVGHFMAPAPNGSGGDVRHLVLANSVNVAECDNGLVWYAGG